METEKKEDKERELDSFLRNAQESRKKPGRDDWGAMSARKGGKNGLVAVVLIAGLVILVLVLFFAVKELKGLKGGGNEGQGPVAGNLMGFGAKSDSSDNFKIDQGKYQAVFLTNGQVYFGKISNHLGDYIELNDIYYLQVKPVLQQGENSNQNQNPQNQQTELSLVKLGNELHGPLDRMMINKDQVVFVEDLKDDSKVTDAIHRYQQDQK